MINTCGLRLLLVRIEQRSLGVLTPRPPIGCYRVHTSPCSIGFRICSPLKPILFRRVGMGFKLCSATTLEHRRLFHRRSFDKVDYCCLDRCFLI
jgi:hypothetical protein